MPQLFDTHSVEPCNRLAFWQEVVCNTFVQLDCETADETRFEGRLLSRPIADLTITDVTASQQRVVRTPRRVACSENEFVLVSLALEGRAGVLQSGREGILEGGDFAIYDTRSPYELHFDGAFHQKVVQIPREFLQRSLGNLEYLTALPVSRANPLGRLAFDFLNALDELHGLHPTQQRRLTEQATDLLVMALVERGCGVVPSHVQHAVLLFRVKDHIQAHLAVPDLTLTDVAGTFGVSTRYINALFQGEGTSFGRYLLCTRIQRCARDLRRPEMANKKISDIAYRWGFNDNSYFSRAFRESFGMTAKEYREQMCDAAR